MTYAMARGVTFFMLMMEATHVLTFVCSDLRRARLLFSRMSAPSPSPSASLAEEGDVKMALKAWKVMSKKVDDYTVTKPLTRTSSFDLRKPSSRSSWLHLYPSYTNSGQEFSDTMYSDVLSRMPALTLHQHEYLWYSTRVDTYLLLSQSHSEGQSSFPHMSLAKPRECLSFGIIRGDGRNSWLTQAATSSLRLEVSSPRAASAPLFSYKIISM